jgi:hypothetical protein
MIYRSGPKYQRPQTSASDLSGNYYYQRDIRRNPPSTITLINTTTPNLIPEGEKVPTNESTNITESTDKDSGFPPRPGTSIPLSNVVHD